MKRWVKVAIPSMPAFADIFEHTALDVYRYGEYPRWIRPVGERLGDHKWKWELREVSSADSAEPNG